ncbi:hypothetical protein [Methylovorus glucosotrophus]|uniref:Uncharacterized protein n=1 Tax=Methylovorus glucosotrophus (strain SIP3-4) TaxID=582744 RepID=C6X7Z3_METGS|nr:hypothetical protein [Methylovorus glucosotrophus]ACT51320.1 hypothetical protein Msip34_2078 [Methylovorus glucosotrophus SIP3-4]
MLNKIKKELDILNKQIFYINELIINPKKYLQLQSLINKSIIKYNLDNKYNIKTNNDKNINLFLNIENLYSDLERME